MEILFPIVFVAVALLASHEERESEYRKEAQRQRWREQIEGLPLLRALLHTDFTGGSMSDPFTHILTFGERKVGHYRRGDYDVVTFFDEDGRQFSFGLWNWRLSDPAPDFDTRFHLMDIHDRLYRHEYGIRSLAAA